LILFGGIVTKFLQRLPEMEGRITTGLALVIAITIGLWPDHPRPVSIEKAAAIAVATLAWLFANLSGNLKPKDHDVALFDQYRENVTDGQLAFLKDSDFAVSFERSNLNGLREINYWDGPRYEFLDNKLQAAWAEARVLNQNFLSLVGQYTIPVRGAQTRSTVHPDGGDPEEPADWVVEQYTELNNAADVLYKKLESFERMAHARLSI